ncbi:MULTISPECIES: alpha-L-arabinofuranosidase C-terminal domain-containing protein [Mesotoga]|uniref:alpha-L-arabinofuranosidase C-terminal domain-containing protein n=2 Tax=Kosmotogaceae TaxID=1643948 RepID=UPI0002CA2645|nr:MULTISPECIES: alpha-L-arabinofuranosidase C-terminal domain-containing protein [Mesotoga]RLL84128.1 alpha-N-arabinofuranosidase [Mesotoga sp. H07pep.5.4]CCU84218.1 Alpha-L-arabinofuranosidase domain protein [Mesotoga infera]HNQ70334.1 alpha-L-arabinofuranosidase C-terminal domain-containing protein [Mesotoga prima]HNS75244.1 alpha-L-arabinofuranosidase C-terminal domain-containing protein [Mesotoga prima]
MRSTTIILTLVFLAVSLSTSALANPDHVLKVDPSSLGPEVSSLLYGIFFEDINHAVDGGLYAEMIRNRSFEHQDPVEGWFAVFESDCKATFSIETDRPLNKNNTKYLSFEIQSDDKLISLSNDGYDGIPLKKGERYLFSVFVRSDEEYNGEIKVMLVDTKGEPVAEKSLGTAFSSEWEKYSVELQPNESLDDGRLIITMKGSGKISFDMVSLFPEENWNGMRIDLLEMLEELKPAFVRFPGGCLVEGDSLENAYRWKDTIGPIEERKTNYNLWGYHQSYGIGFYEYLLLSEHLGAEPIPIFNAGMSCQVRGAEYCPMDEMDEWVQNVLDFIEFANGPSDSLWDSKRSELGHPEPFNVKYIGIGNENWGTEYHDRFPLFREAVKEKYPEITIIFSGPPSYEGASFNRAWRWARSNGIEIFDEHMYAVPEWMLRNTDRYDKYDRSGPKVMLGEYAAHAAGTRNTLQAAIAEAALMTGLERNSDIVIMAAYAPLFNREGWSQWTPDLIWFDNTRVYGTPSYHVQKLFNDNTGDVIIPSSLTDEDIEIIGYWFKSLYHVCSYDYESKELIIKIVNPWPEEKKLRIEIGEEVQITGKAEMISITSENIFDENTFQNPDKVRPKTVGMSDLSNEFTLTFSGNSVTVLRLETTGL